MLIPRVAIKQPVMALMATVAMVVFGLIANATIGVSLFPDVDFPIITVTTVLPGADPETDEQDVSDRVEEAVRTLSGIKTLRSISSEGISQVFVEFEVGTNVDIAAQDVRDKVETVRRDLTDVGAEPPTVEKLDLDAEPVLAVVVRGPGTVREVTEFAEDLKDRLNQVDGVGSVTRVGGREREVRVWLDAGRLEAFDVSALEVVRAIEQQNAEVPGGRLERRGTERPDEELVVKTRGRVNSVPQFEELIVAWRGDSPIRLGMLGRVADGLEDERTISRLDGQPAVSLLVRRRSGENVVAVADNVKEMLADERPELSDTGYELVVTQDQSHFVEVSIDAVKEDVLLGGIFTVLIILLFLRSLRLTAVAAVVIPASLLATVFTIQLLGFTLNNLTMLALSISVGIVVDDAIVMLENIYRHIEMGKPRMQAALDGASEIGFAVIAVSFSLMAVFVPVAFMAGLVGQFFFEFGLAVAAAIFWSLVLSLTLTPMLCSQIISHEEHRSFIARGIVATLDFLDRRYRGILAGALRARAFTLLIAGGVLVGSFVLGGMFLQNEFITQEDRGEFNVVVNLPADLGAGPETTAAVCASIEDLLRENEHVTVTFQAIGADSQQQVNRGTIYVGLVPYEQRPRQEVVMEQVRQQIRRAQEDGRLPDDADLSVSQILGVSGGGFRSQMVQFVITGRNLDELDRIASRVARRLQQTPGFTDVETTYESGKPELDLTPDAERAGQLGLTNVDIGLTVQALVGGVDAGTYSEGGDRVNVRVRLRAADRQTLPDVQRLTVRSPRTGELVALQNVTDISRGEGPTQIERLDTARTVTVLANLGPRPDGTTLALGEAVQIINRIVETEDLLPPGYTARMIGFAEMMAESFAAIFFTMGVSLLVIYLTLASQFNSMMHPFTIMMSVPLAVAGAILALVIGQMTVSIITMIGFLMLFGLVTKNAIILIDFINQLRREGKERNAAILEAGPLRLRPILMTAVSTVAGMVPVAFFGSEGSEVRSPMAVSVIGGMILSTALTLLVVPVIYTLLDDLANNPLSRAIRRWLSPPEPHRAATADTILASAVAGAGGSTPPAPPSSGGSEVIMRGASPSAPPKPAPHQPLHGEVSDVHVRPADLRDSQPWTPSYTPPGSSPPADRPSDVDPTPSRDPESDVDVDPPERPGDAN